MLIEEATVLQHDTATITCPAAHKNGEIECCYIKKTHISRSFRIIEQAINLLNIQATKL